MCGISGIFHFASEAPVSRQSLEQMSLVQQHRGPDGAGLHLAQRVGLANRRLAIVDRPHGQQPMANADGSLWITYNGEIFNYRALRSDLEQRGYRFCTTSDTEVILQAYAAYGAQAVAHLNGQFAFAIWDQRRQQLFLARDRLGIVPLHFAVRDGCFFFASEAKGILAHPDMRPAVDEEGMLQALLCSTPLMQRTLFQGIDSLPPGHHLTVNATGVCKQQYWSLPLAPEAGDGKPAHWYKERIWAVLEDAVHLRLMGEVPLGVLLSGGTDSSTIAKLASRFLPQPLQTFTIDFPNAWKGDDRDASYAALMAQTLNSEHRSFAVDPAAYFSALEPLAWHLERPFNKGATTMYRLYERVREHATVVLCGEGADELLAGYIEDHVGLDWMRYSSTVRFSFFPGPPIGG